MPTFRSKSFILKRQDFKEYDRLLTVYTEKLGKIEVVARGIKKITSKLAGHLEPFNLIDLMVAKGKYRDRVAGSLILENFIQIRSNLEGIILGSYFNEVVDFLTRLHEADKETFTLIQKVYLTIDDYLERNKEKADFRHCYLILLSYLLHFLSLQGFRPEFKTCFYCKKNVKEEINYLSFLHHSVVCPDCQEKEENLKEIYPTTLKILRLMLKNNFPSLRINNLGDNYFEEIQKIINKLLMAISERKLNSLSLIQKIFLNS